MENENKIPFKLEAAVRWRIEGPYDSSYSLALLNRELARALHSMGVDVALFSTEGPGDFEPSDDFLKENPDIDEMHKRSQVIDQINASVTSRNLYPPRVADMHSSMNLMHSYAWEESAFPIDWVRDFNKYLSGMTCLSKHVMKVMQDNGVYLPMVVSGCGVDHWERIDPNRLFILDRPGLKRFRFLHVSSFFPRKGPDALLDAFGRAFTKHDDVTLVIKTFANPHNQVHAQLEEVKKRYVDYPNVIVIEDDLSDSDLKSLYQQCDVLVAPSCAEGFGLPLAEAMLSGLPVIVTGWSGQLDFCNSENAWLVDYQFEQADTHFNLLPSAWVAIDRDALANAMRGALHSSDITRSEMAANGRALLLTHFSWKNVSERLIDFYKKRRIGLDIAPPSIGWISTWNVKCGIATYTEHLISSFASRPVLLAARNPMLLNLDDANCERCWDIGQISELTDLTNAIERYRLNVLVIQFNFGFFHHESLNRFIAHQKSLGCVVVVDMHATIDPPQATDKKMANYVLGLALADRLLVHSIADMNRMKSFGLAENLTLFPHGVLDTPPSQDVFSKVPTIATYGFCLPHKGLSEIIDAVALLNDSGKTVHLKMVNAEYPIDFSASLADQLREKISSLGLSEKVSLESRFLADSESLSILQTADLIIFAYHPTSESASGAVRYGLASGKPTMVTDLPIFAEFGDAVWRVKDNEPANLAKAIWSALDEIRSEMPVYIRNQKVAQNWREQHGYPWLSERLVGLLAALHLARFD